MPDRHRPHRRPELRRRFAALTRGEAVAALAAVLLFVFMFFDWYDYEQVGGLLSLIGLFGFPADAWQSLDVIRWLLVLAILAALGAALLRVSGSEWEPEIPPTAVIAVLGGMATLLVLYRIVFPPDFGLGGIPVAITVQTGAYLSLAAAAGVAYGGYRAMGERGTSFAQVADGLAVKRPAKQTGPKPKRSPRSARSASRRRSPSSSD
jgi:hypothetical protein